ncbi:MAG: SDR family NAD(P)-dependent oxidoreductase [Actinomycetota bacterium]
MGSLEGRRAVVTGGGRGIGRAVAMRLAAEGAGVVVAARTQLELDEVVAEIRSAGGVAAAVRCDVSSDDSVAALAAAAPDALDGPIDTLVNNAGVYLSRRIEDHQLSDWQWIMDLNVISLVRVTDAFLPGLLELPRSRVINMASIAGKKGSFGQAAYNTSKHAQIGYTRCLAIETGATGLRVNAVCPGFTPTELIDLDELGATHGRSGEEVLAGAAAGSSIKRLVTLDEIADAVCYLAGPLADGVNGQSLVVDGGLYMA